MEQLLRNIKKNIPERVFIQIQPFYHYAMALVGAIRYRFPSKHITVVAITGTKGKSSTTEILNAMLEAAGKKTAVAGTIRFKINDKSWSNLYKMTMPGRFFIQKFLRDAVNAGCEYAVIEMTSEGARQYRHKFIDLDALIFLNLSPEHIESHGGYENYIAAKVRLAKALERSSKPRKIIIANADDKESWRFLNINVKEKQVFSLRDAEPFTLDAFGLYMTYGGRSLRAHLQGIFNIYNILAAATYATTQGISVDHIQKSLEKLNKIPGRVQKIELSPDDPLKSKQIFTVVVDYAHTADSLQKIYEVFDDTRIIGVLGNTGGGRDKWKRKEMGKVANDHCNYIILTNEDPYDENPKSILDEMVQGIDTTPYEIIMDRREAIRKAISLARNGDAVIITGKGTDPYIMEADGKRTPWSDARVAKEEIEYVLNERENKKFNSLSEIDQKKETIQPEKRRPKEPQKKRI